MKKGIVYQRLNVSDLNVDYKYQRDISKARVKRMIKDFKPGAIGALIVSQRKDACYIVDGQHRAAALTKLGIESVMCLIHYDLTLREEALLYYDCNFERKSPSASDNLKALLVAEDDSAFKIVQILKSHGIGFKYYQDKKGSIKMRDIKAIKPDEDYWHEGYRVINTQAFRVIQRIYREDGPEALLAILGIINELWQEWDALKPQCLNGLAMLLRDYGNEIKVQELVKILSKVDFYSIWRRAAQLKYNENISGGKAFARVILQVYNKGRSSRKLENKYLRNR